MKEYNCPDCKLETCEGCPRTLFRDENTKIDFVPPYYPDSIQWGNNSYIPNCCKHCSNHPSNGGSGICNCVAPLYDPSNPYKITCSTVDSNTYLIEG